MKLARYTKRSDYRSRASGVMVREAVKLWRKAFTTTDAVNARI